MADFDIDDMLGPEMVKRLADLGASGHSVLSMYVDLDPSQFPTPHARQVELGSMMDQARRDGAAEDADRIGALFASRPELVHEAQAVAAFSSVGDGMLEVVPLSIPVKSMVVWDKIPWLEPLIAAAPASDWGVAVVSRRAARLFRGNSERLVEFAAFADDVHGRQRSGGLSADKYQRATENEVDAHAARVGSFLLRAHVRRPFGHLVIVAAAELWPVVERRLNGELLQVLAGTVTEDLEQADQAQILSAVAPLMDRVAQDHEQDLLNRLEHELGTGGRAAEGPVDTLAALGEKRVETLLVGESDVAERAVEEAERESAQVVVVRYETEWIARHGGIAAILRW